MNFISILIVQPYVLMTIAIQQRQTITVSSSFNHHSHRSHWSVISSWFWTIPCEGSKEVTHSQNKIISSGELIIKCQWYTQTDKIQRFVTVPYFLNNVQCVRTLPERTAHLLLPIAPFTLPESTVILLLLNDAPFILS